MHQTKVSGLRVAAAMDHEVEGPDRTTIATEGYEDWLRTTVGCVLKPGEKLRVIKYLAYGWSSRRSLPALRDQVDAALAAALLTGWDGLLPRAAGVPGRVLGRPPTCTSTATPRCSRRSGSGSSTCSRPVSAPNGGRSPQRDSPAPATTGTPSGTPRRSCCRC